MDPSLQARKIEDLDKILRGDGQKQSGLVARVGVIEVDMLEVRAMMQEWRDAKAQLRGARTALIVIGVIITTLGGSLGVAILQTLRELAKSIP